MELPDLATIVYRTLREAGGTEAAVMASHYATEMNIRILFIVPWFYLRWTALNRTLDSKSRKGNASKRRVRLYEVPICF
jgi:hypothetical protein